MHFAKGRIKHICKLLLWSRKGQLLAHCLLPRVLLVPRLPDRCGAMDGGVLSAGACLENHSLSQKTRCANVHFRGFLQAVVQGLCMDVEFYFCLHKFLTLLSLATEVGFCKMSLEVFGRGKIVVKPEIRYTECVQHSPLPKHSAFCCCCRGAEAARSPP